MMAMVRAVDSREECHWSHACSLHANMRGIQWHPRAQNPVEKRAPYLAKHGRYCRVIQWWQFPSAFAPPSCVLSHCAASKLRQIHIQPLFESGIFSFVGCHCCPEMTVIHFSCTYLCLFVSEIIPWKGWPCQQEIATTNWSRGVVGVLEGCNKTCKKSSQHARLSFIADCGQKEVHSTRGLLSLLIAGKRSSRTGL
jgi:hypothetical protein